MQTGGFLVCRCERPSQPKLNQHLEPRLEWPASDVAKSVGAGHDDAVTHGTFEDLVATRTELLVQALGSVTRVADCLGVSRTVVSRWRAGTLLPTLAQARLLVDLDHVVARASIIFEPPAVWNWVTGSNSYLQGARPIDVLQIRGAGDVIRALDAAEQLAFG